jgi:hypothetical protein
LVIKRIESPTEPQIEPESVPEPVKVDNTEDTVEGLRKQLDAKGIAYHHKAGIDKLKSLLTETHEII